MSEAAKTAVVLGVGALDGLGGQLAMCFGTRGHTVFVGGRTQASLDSVADAIRKAGGRAEAVVTDATDQAQVSALFAAADSGGRLDLAIYNAGNNMPGRVMDMAAGFFEQAWRVCCFGGFMFAQAAIPRLEAGGGGCLFFTGASASLRGKAGFGAFNSAKGGLRNLAQALAKEHGPNGVHVGHVIVDGGIDGEILKTRRPERFRKEGNQGLVSLQGLVESYAFLYQQPPAAWTFELDIRTNVENW